MKYNDIPLVINEANHNFEFTVNGYRSFIDFNQRGETVTLIHTEVPVELEGNGVASAMVERTLQYLEERNLKLVPACSYVRAFLKRHPEWNRLL